MVQRFRARWSELARRKDTPEPADAFTTVILASLIEKETGRPDEKPLVSSVLANRLARRIPLGCDPTIIYALKLEGRFDGNLRKTDLSLDSPYNTYRRIGLPPGPIANPGIDSIRAALEPAETGLLYYVSRNDGSHEFSADYAAHLRAVGRWQKPRPSR